MIYLIIALALAVGAAGLLGWRLYGANRALERAESRCRSMQKDRAIRQNLQYMLDGRDEELRRLRGQLREYEAQAQEMESRASELNLSLFHESGLRILAEKEDGAKRMKMDLMERQLDDANRKLKELRQESAQERDRLNAIIAKQAERIEQLSAPQPRRAARRNELPDQISLDDLLK